MIPLTTIPAGRLLDDMLIAPNPDPDDPETYARVIRSDLLSSQPTAYDVIAATDDLSLFKEWVDSAPLYQAYLQSGEPVIVYAIANEDFPEGLIGPGFTWFPQPPMPDPQWRDNWLLSQMIMVPSSEWVETNDSIQRTYLLSNGGAVLILDEILDVTHILRDPGEPLIIPDGQVALALPLTGFAVPGASLMPGDMLYSRRLDVSVTVFASSSLRHGLGFVMVVVDPDNALRITEFIEENPDEPLFEFVPTLNFQEDQPGSCDDVAVFPAQDSVSWQRPVDAEVDRTFSDIHTGVDFMAEAGTPVEAAADGRVIFSGWNGFGYGNMVAIAHGGYITVYAHLSANYTSCGQDVHAGQVIGEVGSSGNTAGTNLHFEVRELTAENMYSPIDPMTVLEGAE